MHIKRRINTSLKEFKTQIYKANPGLGWANAKGEGAKQTAGNCGKPKQQNTGESALSLSCYCDQTLTRRDLRPGGFIWLTVPGETHRDGEGVAAGGAQGESRTQGWRGPVSSWGWSYRRVRAA